MKWTCILLLLLCLKSDMFGAESLNESATNVPAAVAAYANTQECIEPAFRLFPTQNLWTFIKLDTRNGKMWQVQYDTEGNNRREDYLNVVSLVYKKEDEVNGRFTLYPTQNMYNFLLLDQIDGRIWQVQWSHEIENRLVLPIR